jgi:hypothetical protein
MEDYFFGLQNEISMVIGNENHTLFWTSKYLGDSTLMFGFPTLYVVCGNPNPNAKISDMGTWNDNSWTWSLSWRRRL